MSNDPRQRSSNLAGAQARTTTYVQATRASMCTLYVRVREVPSTAQLPSWKV